MSWPVAPAFDHVTRKRIPATVRPRANLCQAMIGASGIGKRSCSSNASICYGMVVAVLRVHSARGKGEHRYDEAFQIRRGPDVCGSRLTVLGIGCSGGLVQDSRGVSPIEDGAAAAPLLRSASTRPRALRIPRQRPRPSRLRAPGRAGRPRSATGAHGRRRGPGRLSARRGHLEEFDAQYSCRRRAGKP